MTGEQAKTTLLIVDDTLENLQLLMGILSESGYDVRLAPSGDLAIKFANVSPPDLILLDIRMPGKDGYEVCQELKRNERTSKIPVIFISALNELSDKVKGFQLGAVDFITKPFQPEEVLSRVQTHLSIALLRRELEEKNATLESTNRELKDFAYIVSHDLKAPLRGINQLVSWLLEDYADHFDEQGRELTELLTGRVKRMNEMIDGILQYSRAGRLGQEKEAIELTPLVNDVLSLLDPPEHIRISIRDELPCVIGETTSIRQLFQNLLSNAITYMDKAEGKIELRCVDDHSHWTFCVADNGPGIEQRFHDKVFNIFQTLQHKDRNESTGIGLTIVKKIVEAYGGKLWLESIPGRGSEFYFTFPQHASLDSSTT